MAINGERQQKNKELNHWFKIYLICCLGYICLNVLVNYYVINTLLVGVLSTSQPLQAYGLTLFAVMMSLLSLWYKVKEKL